MEDNYKESNIDYSAEFVVGQKENYEVSQVAYKPIAKHMMIMLILFGAAGILHLITNDFQTPAYGFASIMIILAVSYFSTGYKIALSYEKSSFACGKSEIKYTIQFSDCITVSTDVHAPVNYDYNMIESINETNSFYILTLPYDLFVIADKNSIINYTDTDFISYLLAKCTNIKKKRVINVNKAKLLCKIYLIIFAVVFVMLLLLTIITTIFL